MRRAAVALALAGVWLLAPISAYSDTDLTALISATYFPRIESLHDLAHQRAQYQVTYSGGVCASDSLTHDGWTTAEVLACNYTGPARAVEQWLGSPAHHAILSDPTYTDIGCAAAYGTDGSIFFACVLSGGNPTVTVEPSTEGVPGTDSGAGLIPSVTPHPATPPVLLPNTATR